MGTYGGFQEILKERISRVDKCELKTALDMTKRISDAIEQRNREIEFKRKVEAIKECHKNAREKIDKKLNEQQRQINQLMEFMK